MSPNDKYVRKYSYFLSDLSPRTKSLICFVVYIIAWTIAWLYMKYLFISYDDVLPYSVAGCVFLTELSKLILSLAYFVGFPQNDGSHETPSDKIGRLVHLFIPGLYLVVPTVLYLIFNLLQYTNLKLLDPGTVQLLLNCKVLISAFLVQLIFDIRKSRVQWMSLLLLIVGCGLGQMSSVSFIIPLYTLLIVFIQAFCSSLAGVYFQWLLQKKDTLAFGLWEKNIYLYFWGIISNLGYCYFFAPSFVNLTDWQHYDYRTLILVLTNSLAGFSTSFLLKYLDAILKEYANGIGMFTLALLQYLILGINFNLMLIVGTILVTISLFIYQKYEGYQPILPTVSNEEKLSS